MDKLSELETLATETHSDNLARILELTNDVNEEVRMRAFELLIDYESNTICRIQVRKGLHDVDELVRATCAEILGDWKDQESLETLVTMALKDRSHIVSMYAIVAIGDLGNRTIIPRLKHLVTQVNRRKSFFFYYALYRLDGSLIYLQKFLNGLQNEDYHLRCAVANLCIEIVNDSNQDFLLIAVQEALKKEKTVAARSSMQTFLAKIPQIL